MAYRDATQRNPMPPRNAETCARWEEFLGIVPSQRWTKRVEKIIEGHRVDVAVYKNPPAPAEQRIFNDFMSRARVGVHVLDEVERCVRENDYEGQIYLGLVPDELVALGVPRQRMLFPKSHVRSCLAGMDDDVRHPHNLNVSTLVRRLTSIGDAAIICKSWKSPGLTLVYDSLGFEDGMDWPFVAGLIPYAGPRGRYCAVASVYPMQNIVQRMNHAVQLHSTEVYKVDTKYMDWMEQFYGIPFDQRLRRIETVDMAKVMAHSRGGSRRRGRRTGNIEASTVVANGNEQSRRENHRKSRGYHGHHK